jgi:hypothetical protein
MTATPLLAHSREHVPAGLAATLDHIVGQVKHRTACSADMLLLG